MTNSCAGVFCSLDWWFPIAEPFSCYVRGSSSARGGWTPCPWVSLRTLTDSTSSNWACCIPCSISRTKASGWSAFSRLTLSYSDWSSCATRPWWLCAVAWIISWLASYWIWRNLGGMIDFHLLIGSLVESPKCWKGNWCLWIKCWGARPKLDYGLLRWYPKAFGVMTSLSKQETKVALDKTATKAQWKYFTIFN